jgi:hypothetical protein
LEQLQQGRGDIRVFTAGNLVSLLDHGYPGAEAAHRLRQLKSDISAAQHDEVLRQAIQFESLDVGHGF